MALDVSTASLVELQAEFVRLAGELAAIANQRQAIDEEMTRRKAQVRAQERVGALDEKQREALRDVLENAK